MGMCPVFPYAKHGASFKACEHFLQTSESNTYVLKFRCENV
jgi:hypothetical protein